MTLVEALEATLNLKYPTPPVECVLCRNRVQTLTPIRSPDLRRTALTCFECWPRLSNEGWTTITL